MPKQTSARPNRRTQAKAESRQALIRAAVELMPAEGLDVSLDRLCAHAGYTRGAFYQHFSDRDALLAAVMEYNGHQVLSQILGEGSDNLDGGALMHRIVGVATGQLKLSDRPRLMRTHQLLEACYRSKDVRHEYQSLLSRAELGLASAISTAQTQGRIRSELDNQALARLAILLFVGVRALEGIIDPVDSQIMETILRMMAKREQSTRGRTSQSDC